MFTPDGIQARVRERPFVPLRIVTSAGQAFDIYHPDFMQHSRPASNGPEKPVPNVR